MKSKKSASKSVSRAMPKEPAAATNAKTEDLGIHTEVSEGEFLTTNHGVRINDNQNTLKAGDRGPSLLEDFIFREKMTHFDHERIPERIVHARGSGAHGIFQVYKSLNKYTRAQFLCEPEAETPVFVRFSTVAGSRGSTDLARDARGFSVKFYTQEGNFDLVGNNMPVFFIQDAMKFPDLVHAIKPEPNNEIPQASAAHNTFWDFISLMPESAHMIMWVMSDRAIPRSYRMMEGFGVHTFRLVNAKGESTFVKFHWKPLLGTHAVTWDEAQKISGKDPDFHRRDLWDAIESGAFPEWELGLQLVPEADEHKYDFDLLDPTKLIPEELVPVQRVGKLTLNRNPDNFFAETEQIAFHVGHVVPGIDFTNDPLLQGRLFSYTDTQLKRLGGPNFHEIPINRPVAPVHNNQRDGHMRQTINRGATSYEPNTLSGGCPFQASMADGGFASFAEKVDAHKVRGRSRSFFDHFSQATMFLNSMTVPERTHLTKALCFELGKVSVNAIRERMVGVLTMVDEKLAADVAESLGISPVPGPVMPMNHGVSPDQPRGEVEPIVRPPAVDSSAALSMTHLPGQGIATRKIAILAGDGVKGGDVKKIDAALRGAGAVPTLVAPHHGMIRTAEGKELKVDESLLTTCSVLFDAVYVLGGEDSVPALEDSPEAIHFVSEAFKHCKAIGCSAGGMELLRRSYVSESLDLTEEDRAAQGVVLAEGDSSGSLPERFIDAVSHHRFWEFEALRAVPAKGGRQGGVM